MDSELWLGEESALGQTEKDRHSRYPAGQPPTAEMLTDWPTQPVSANSGRQPRATESLPEGQSVNGDGISGALIRAPSDSGVVADKWGRRPAIIIPAIIAIFITPLYLWTEEPALIIVGFIIQGIFGGSIYGQNPSYLSERFPTEVRATAAGFVYHQGAIWGGLIAPVLTYFAVQMNMGFAMPMLISTSVFLLIVIVSVLLGPETRGKHLSADLEVIRLAEVP